MALLGVSFSQQALFNSFFNGFTYQIYLQQISNEWGLGPELCDMWTSSDVLCCTASILHLVAIALDRSVEDLFLLVIGNAQLEVFLLYVFTAENLHIHYMNHLLLVTRNPLPNLGVWRTSSTRKERKKRSTRNVMEE